MLQTSNPKRSYGRLRSVCLGDVVRDEKPHSYLRRWERCAVCLSTMAGITKMRSQREPHALSGDQIVLNTRTSWVRMTSAFGIGIFNDYHFFVVL